MAGKSGVSKTAATETDALSCYETPRWLVERISDVLDGIDLDPCSTDANPCGARRYYTPANDGILQSWEARSIYMNPPYGRTIKHWVEKALVASKQGARVVILVPSRTCSRWFHSACDQADDVLFIRNRLKFGDMKDNAPFPSVLMGFNISLAPLADLGWRAQAA